MTRAEMLTARVNDETRRANDAVMRAGELERASLDLAGRVNTLEQVADRLALRVVEREQTVRELTKRLEMALGELRNADEAGEPAPSDADGDEEDASEVDATAGPPAADGSAPGADEIFKGLIEVEVGPLSDFEQLASFEDAASGIGAAEGITVKRFTQGRATLELELSEPVSLLHELEERAPFDFKVRDTRENRVVLDVDSDGS